MKDDKSFRTLLKRKLERARDNKRPHLFVVVRPHLFVVVSDFFYSPPT